MCRNLAGDKAIKNIGIQMYVKYDLITKTIIVIK